MLKKSSSKKPTYKVEDPAVLQKASSAPATSSKEEAKGEPKKGQEQPALARDKQAIDSSGGGGMMGQRKVTDLTFIDGNNIFFLR